MPFTFNPFTGNFDAKGAGGGGSAFFAGEVATYAHLPLDGTAPLNSRWLVRSNSGTWPFSSYKQGGIYIRSATGGTDRDADYTFVGQLPDVFSDDKFLLYDEDDATKNLKFQLSGIDTGTTRTLTAPDASGTISLEGHTHTAADIDSGEADANYVLTSDGDGGASWEEAGGGATTQTDIFTANGTWTKPAGAKLVHYLLISGGGGGGGGRRSDASTAASGGSGGNGGGVIVGWADASYFAATETITVGAGGAGGVARTADNTNGANGANGGNSSFGSTLVATPVTSSGTGGSTAALGYSTNITNAILYYGTLAPTARGGATSITANSEAGIQSNINPSAGGGGGSKSSGGAYYLGGAGGTIGEAQNRVGQTAGGQPAANSAGGNGGRSHLAFFGTGGAGGSPDSATGAANKGGNGGLYGGGGGGGSGSLNGAGGDNSGGDGADGIVVITTYF